MQEHFIDLCALVGHETRMGQGPSATRFAFEIGAAKTGGRVMVGLHHHDNNIADTNPACSGDR